jgi:hypothetical protein
MCWQIGASQGATHGVPAAGLGCSFVELETSVTFTSPRLKCSVALTRIVPAGSFSVGILEIAPHEPPGEPFLSHVNCASVKNS